MTNDTADTAATVQNHAQQAAASAQDRAGEVTAHAQDAAHQVAGTAAEQAKNLQQETVRQARNLHAEAGNQLSDQAGQQTQRLAGGLRDLGDELKGMAEGGQHGGTATELVHQAAERVHSLAGYLEGREPAELLEDLRSYARRSPGAFLAGAAALGLVAGRLGRGVKDAGSSGGESGGATASGPGEVRLDEAVPTAAGVIPPVGAGIQPAEFDTAGTASATRSELGTSEPLYAGSAVQLDENGVRL